MDSIVKEALANNLLPKVDENESIEDKPIVFAYDLDAWDTNLKTMRQESFLGSHFLHALALKSNPMIYFLNRARLQGHGAECASIGEVFTALEAGFKPEDIVYDSPCKTLGEIKFSMTKGIHINVDNFQELDRVESLINKGTPTNGVIGVRINPLVGAGTILAFSVSTGKSKFGVPLPKLGEQRDMVIDRIVNAPYVSCIHVHTGSGGMGLDQLVAGVRCAIDAALEINKRAGRKQINVLDIGGGLSVDFDSKERMSQFPEYAAALREQCPEIFDPTIFDRVVTEFGNSSNSKFAYLLARVEYTKKYDGAHIALIHAGSDVFVRTSYCPGVFIKHDAYAFDNNGNPKTSYKPVSYDIAGPLCFAGDVVVRDVELPELNPDDILVITNAGGNTLSIRSSHCTRQAPKVYAFHREGSAVVFEKVQDIQSIESAIAQWKSR